MRLRPFSGTKRVSAMALQRELAEGRASPVAIERAAFILPALLGAALGDDASSGRSIAMNHCGVQRKMTLAFERQLNADSCA